MLIGKSFLAHYNLTIYTMEEPGPISKPSMPTKGRPLPLLATNSTSCMAWVALLLSGLFATVAMGALLLVLLQKGQYRHLHSRLDELQANLQLLEARLNQVHQVEAHDYLYDPKDGHDIYEKGGSDGEELTVHKVVRRRRESIGNNDVFPVPIYKQGYVLQNEKRLENSEGLRLYESLLETDGRGDPLSSKVSRETNGDNHIGYRLSKSKHRFKVTPMQKLHPLSRKNTSESIPNHLWGNIPTVVEQPNQPHQHHSPRPTYHDDTFRHPDGVWNKKNNSVLKQSRQKNKKRRPQNVLTAAHFYSTPIDNTIGYFNRPRHKWTSASWMNKFVGSKKYHLQHSGGVLVKDPGLYYIYAQLVYSSGFSNGGYQIMVDDLPVLMCTLDRSFSTNSCHTSGLTYLPKGAVVKITEMDKLKASLRQPEGSFFGLVKLMEDPANNP